MLTPSSPANQPTTEGAYWQPRADRLQALADELARMLFALGTPGEHHPVASALAANLAVARASVRDAARSAAELAGGAP